MIYLWLPTAERHTPTAVLFVQWCRSSGGNHWNWQLPALPFQRSLNHTKIKNIMQAYSQYRVQEIPSPTVYKWMDEWALLLTCMLCQTKGPLENVLTLMYMWAKTLWRFSVFFLFHPMACCVSIVSLPDWKNKSACVIGSIYMGKTIAVRHDLTQQLL